MAKDKATIAYFDLVRGTSAQLVLIGHSLNLFLPGIFMLAAPTGRWGTRSDVLYIQNVGVVLFFVLSGFLVTRSLRDKPPSYGLAAYLTDRSARILVPFVPAVVLIWLADLVVFGRTGTSQFTELPLGIGTVIGNLLLLFDNGVLIYTSRLVGHPIVIQRVGSADPFWSVSVEWWIYLVFGIAWLAKARRLRWNLVLVAFFLFATGTTLANLVGHPAVVLAWVTGMAYALGSEHLDRLPAWVHGALSVAGLGLAATTCLAAGGDVNVPTVTLGLSVAVMSGYHAIGRRRPRARRQPRRQWPSGVSKFVSGYSYSLYLVHFSVLIYLESLLPAGVSGVARIALGFVLANAVAICFWWLFERHYVRIGRLVRARLDSRRNPLDERTVSRAGA